MTNELVPYSASEPRPRRMCREEIEQVLLAGPTYACCCRSWLASLEQLFEVAPQMARPDPSVQALLASFGDLLNSARRIHRDLSKDWGI